MDLSSLWIFGIVRILKLFNNIMGRKKGVCDRKKYFLFKIFLLVFKEIREILWGYFDYWVGRWYKNLRL